MAHNLPYSPMTGEEAARLGYRTVSHRHLTVSRIDRPDWLEFMARQGYDQSGRWKGDYYRRVYSRDTLVLQPAEFAKVPASADDCPGFVATDDHLARSSSHLAVLAVPEGVLAGVHGEGPHGKRESVVGEATGVESCVGSSDEGSGDADGWEIEPRHR